MVKGEGKGMIIKINQEFKLEKRKIKNGEGRESSEVKNQWIINPNGVEKYWKWHSCHKKCKIACAGKVKCLTLRSWRGCSCW